MRASESNDFRTVDRLMDAQLSEVMSGLVLEDYTNGSVGAPFSRRMLGANAEVNASAIALQIVRRNRETNRILEEGGWGQLEAYGNDIVRRYKERNGADKVVPHAGMSEEELVQASLQFEPIRVDPNEIAGLRQQLTKIDQNLRQVGSSVWTDPRTARIANILQTSAEPGRPGLLQDTEQDINQQLGPFTKYVGLPVVEGIDAFVGGAAEVGVGIRSVLHDLGLVTLDGLTQGNADTVYNGPTSWVQDSDGKWYHNGGKVGATEVYAGVWHMLTGELIDQQMAEYADTKARAAMQASGIQGLAVGVGQFMGSMGAFIGTGGPAMKAGSLLTKGLGIAITGAKAGKSLSRTAQVVKLLAEKSGPAAALGVLEATKSGRVEGYGKALLHGTVMAVPMMVMGAIGDRLERTLGRYVSMPKPMSRFLAGTVEGVGLDIGTWDAGWQFVKDPNRETLANLQQTVLVNMIGNGIMRGTGVTAAHHHAMTPDQAEAMKNYGDSVATYKAERRKEAMSRLQRRKDAKSRQAQEVASERGAMPETVEKLGKNVKEMESAVGIEPDLAMAAKRDVRATEERLDLEEAGLTKTDSEKLEGRNTARNKIIELNSQEHTPERQAKIKDVLEGAREDYGRFFPDFVKKTAHEVNDDGTIVESLLGSKAAEDYKQFKSQRVERGQPSEEFHAQVREEIAKLREGEWTSEKTKRLIELMDAAKSRAFKGITKTFKNVGAEIQKDQEIAEKVLDEMWEAAEVSSALVQKIPVTEFKKAQQKAFAEAGLTVRPRKEPEGKKKPGGKPKTEDDEIANMARMAGISIEEARKLMSEGEEPPPDVAPSREETPRATPETAPEIVEARAPSAPRPGQPASLRMEPSLEQEGVPGTQPTRARDVLADMEGFEGDPVRPKIGKGVGIRGRFSTKGILGWYALYENNIRLRGARNLVVGSHEWAHAMDIAMGGTKGIWGALSQAEAEGFIKAAHPYYPGYDKLPKRSQAMESWAEFWARHLLDDPLLKEETGAFHQYAMRWLANPARASLRAQMDRIQDGLRRFRDQGAVERGRQEIVFESDEKSIQDLKKEGIMKDTPLARARGAVRKSWDILMKTMVDDLHELKQAQRKWIEIAYGKNFADAALADTDITANPTRLLDAFRMTASKQAEAFLAIGTHDLAGNRTGEALRDIFQDIGEARYKDFIVYIAAKRHLEMMDKGLDVLHPRQEYLTRVEKLENKDFIRGAQRIRAWSDRLIDYATQGGLFSAEQAKAIKESYEHYIPFQRVLEGPEQHAPGRGVAERGTGVKKMKGGQEEIRDPVNALGDMARNIIAKTHQAMVMKAMVKFGIVHKGIGGFISEVKRGVIPREHPMAQIAEAIRKAETPSTFDKHVEIDVLTRTLEDLAAAGEIGPSITLFGQQTIPKGSRPIIAYTPHFTEAELQAMPQDQQRLARHKNGRLLWLEVDVNAYDALMGIDVPQTVLDKLPDAVKIAMETPTKLLRFGATMASPGFAVRNMVRDITSDYIYSSDKNKSWLFSGVSRFAKGVIEQRNDTHAAQLFDALGGGVSTFFSGEVAAGRTAREMLSLNRNWYQNAKHALGAWSDWLAKNTEQPLRTEAFKRTRERALNEGKTELSANLEALEAAKEVTINFARGGTIGRALNRLIPYTGAGIQGTRKFFMTLAGKNGDVAQRSAWMRALTGITLPAVALWWLQKDEEWYQELPEWRRLNYWNFKLPGMDRPMSIPKPFEIGKLFGNVPEMMLEQATMERPLGARETATDAVIALLPPLPIPAIARPAIEVMTNFDFFTRRPLVPEWLSRSRMPEDQRTAYTRWFGDLGAALARGLGLDPSPIVVEHLIDAYTGGMAGRLSDSIVSAGGVTSILKGEGPRDVPVIGTLFRQGQFEQSRSVQRIFDLDAEFTRRAGSQELSGDEQADRRLVSRAKDDIANLKAASREGTMPRQQADARAAEIARETLRSLRK